MHKITFISKNESVGGTTTSSIELVNNTSPQKAIEFLLNDIKHWNGLSLNALQKIIIE